MYKKSLLDGITGNEPWIGECLNRLQSTGELQEMATNRVAILEALGYITRTNDIGTDYCLTDKGKKQIELQR